MKLHHACTAFIALLCCAHVLAVVWTIQYEEVWAGLNARQKLGRSLHILLFDSYLSRTKADNRAACPIVDFVPKVSERAECHHHSWEAGVTACSCALLAVQYSKHIFRVY